MTAAAAQPTGTAAEGMPAGQELRAVVELVAPALRGSAARLWRQEGVRERYPRYLVAMHAVIRASVPLMEAALARCGGRGDPVLDALGGYLPGHIAGERGHDALLLRDIAAAGVDPERALAVPPPPEVARLVGAQYYWLAHFHPLCLLGYIAVLELNAPAPPLAALLAERTGLPAAAFASVRLHAGADTGHSAAVLAALDRIGPPPRLRHAVRLSALHTVRALAEVLDGLSAAVPGPAHVRVRAPAPVPPPRERPTR